MKKTNDIHTVEIASMIGKQHMEVTFSRDNSVSTTYSKPTRQSIRRLRQVLSRRERDTWATVYPNGLAVTYGLY